MNPQDYYETLGVAKTADAASIKKAYRKIAFENHPDRNPGDETAEKTFKAAANAYAILSDRQKRAQYDRFGHAGVGAGPVGQGGPGGFTNVDDIFSSFGDVFEEIFGFGTSGSGGRGHRGADIRHDLELTFEEAATGLKKELAFNQRTHCDDCKGSGAASSDSVISCLSCAGRGTISHAQGFFSFASACPRCRGTGKVIRDHCRSCRGSGVATRQRKLLINVPAGIDAGSRIRVRGEGSPGEHGGPSGDLYVFIHLLTHPIFDRDEENLICRIPISFSQAILGKNLTVPTLAGSQTIKIHAGTQYGDTLVIRGGGFPRLNGRGKGDQIIQFIVEIPKKVSRKQKALLEELEDLDRKNAPQNVEDLIKKIKRLRKS